MTLGLSGPGVRIILVGAERFADGRLPDLPAVHSLSLVRKALIAACEVAPANIPEPMIIHTAAHFGRELNRAAGEATEVLLVYYVGHGLLGDNGELFLTVAETDPDPGHLPYSAVDYERIRQTVSASRAAVRIVVLDCCYSGRAIPPTLAAPALDEAIPAELARIKRSYVICSSPRGAASLLKPDRTVAAFSAEFAAVLIDGVPAAGPTLKITTVLTALQNRLVANGYPRPDGLGNADIVLARNTAYLPPDEQAPAVAPPSRRRVWAVLAAATVAAIGVAAFLIPLGLDDGRTPLPEISAGSPTLPARIQALVDGLGSSAAPARTDAAAALGELARTSTADRPLACAQLQTYLVELLPFPRVEPWMDPKMPELAYRAAAGQEALDQLGAVPCPDIKLQEIDLRMSRLAGDFSAADLDYTAFYRADLTDGTFTGTSFEAAHLYEVKAAGAAFVNAVFDGAEFNHADFSHANLHGAFFRTVPDRRTNLWWIDLTGADLRGAHLNGADLSSATLTDALFEGAVADNETLWPDGFDWRAAGVTVQ